MRGPKSTQRNIWNVLVQSLGYNSCTIRMAICVAFSPRACWKRRHPAFLPWLSLSASQARPTAATKMGGVIICKRNLLMNGTDNAQFDIDRRESTSRLTMTPVPLEYAAKSAGQASLYVTVKADRICSQETVIDIKPDSRETRVSSTRSSDMVVRLSTMSMTIKSTSATTERPRTPAHSGEPPSHAMHSPSYST